jgi:hypothetical protein
MGLPLERVAFSVIPLITKDKNIFTFLEKTIVYLKSMPIFVEQKAIKKKNYERVKRITSDTNKD